MVPKYPKLTTKYDFHNDVFQLKIASTPSNRHYVVLYYDTSIQADTLYTPDYTLWVATRIKANTCFNNKLHR